MTNGVDVNVGELCEDAVNEENRVPLTEKVVEEQSLAESEINAVDDTLLDPIDAVTLGLTALLGESESVLELSDDALRLLV